MQSKVFVLLSALWLALTPALCAAGVLTHPCDCPSETTACDSCCESEELGCDCIDDGCSHDGCENDPCQVVTAPQDEAAAKVVLSATPMLLWVPHLVAQEETLERRLVCDTSSPPGLGKNLPYFLSDLPLRI